MGNLDLYDSVRRPPKKVLKRIEGGRLKGMTDINPQWRYEALTDQLGPCGIGWKYNIVKLWMDQGAQDQIIAWAEIALFVKVEDKWSEPIPGIGGSTFIAKEKNGLYTSDEAYKMAVTDALSVACKMLGFGADIYAGKWDGSKYKEHPESNAPTPQKETTKTVGGLMKKVLCPDTNNSKLFDKEVAEKYCGTACNKYEGCPAYDSVNEDEIPL